MPPHARFLLIFIFIVFEFPFTPLLSQPWQIRHEPPRSVPQNTPLELTFSIDPNTGFRAVFFYYRSGSQEKFTSKSAAIDEHGSFKVTLFGSDLKGSELQYFIAVQDFSGRIHSVLGSAQSPLKVPIVAQAPPPSGGEEELQGLSELELEFKLLELQQQEVVVTAGKRAQKITEAPAPVYVFTHEDLEMYGVRRVTDLLRFAPALRVQKVNESTTLVGIRGFASESNNLVLFLVGGQEKNLEIFGAPLWEAEPVLLNEAERIEIVRGPGSVLYGANAFSGVIQMITRRPQAFIRSVDVSYDRDFFFRSQSSRFFVRGVSGDTGYLLSSQWHEEGSDSDPRARTLKKLSTHGKLTLEGSLPLEIDLNAVNFEGELFSVLGETPQQTNHYSLTARTSVGKTRIRLTGIHWDALMGIRDPILNPILPAFHWRSDTGDGEIQFSHEIEDLNALTLGLQGRYNSFLSPEQITPSVKEGRVGIYIQDELRPVEFILLNAGLRSDFSTLYLRESPLNERITLSPRVSLIVPFLENHSIRVGVGKAFRKPTFFETLMAFQALAPLDLNPQNPRLRNEEVTGFDLGYVVRVLGIGASVDLFLNQYQRFIEFDPGLVRYTNVSGKTRSFGGEAALRWDSPDGHLSTFFNYSYLKVQREEIVFTGFREVTRLADLKRDPEHMINAGFRYRTPFGLKLSLLFHWQSAHVMQIVNPEKGSLLFAVSEAQEIKPYFNIFSRIAYDFGNFEMGILGEHLEADRHTEFPTLNLTRSPSQLFPEPTGTVYGGERVAPRLFVYLEGKW